MTWLSTLLAKIESLTPDEYIEPPMEVPANAHVVGEMSDYLRRLATLLFVSSASLEAAKNDLGGSVRPEDRVTLEIGNHVHKVLLHTFWLSCREEFPQLAGKTVIAITKGWKVVWEEARPHPAQTSPPDLHEFIRALAAGHGARGGDYGIPGLKVIGRPSYGSGGEPGGGMQPRVDGLPPGYDRTKK